MKSIEVMFSDLGPSTDLEAFGHAILGKISLKANEDYALLESMPQNQIGSRVELERLRLVDAIDGFFQRELLKRSITDEQRKWMLSGIILTRAVDLTLKKIFMSSEIKYKDVGFQGKGFRSLGQEAIYAAALFLRHGREFTREGSYFGDVIGPLIRDLGVSLAFTDNDVVSALNAQAAKQGPPTNGRDLHIGDFSRGVWPPAAPLAISTCSVVGIAQAFQLQKQDRVCVSFIGEGGSSLGEWHEAINFAGARKLPMVFCVQNNQTALSTKLEYQSAARTFADKAQGYGITALTLDGTKPEDIAVSFGWAAHYARKQKGPVLLELVSMRMCGHAHHDDMLYLGHEPTPSLEYPMWHENGYANKEAYRYWSEKDPIVCYANELIQNQVCTKEEVSDLKAQAEAQCEKALSELKKRSWPVAPSKCQRKFEWPKRSTAASEILLTHFSASGSTFMEAIALAVKESMDVDKRVYLLGEDVSPPYGNAFMMFRSMPKDLWPRFINTPIAENAIVGALVGMASQGLRPIGEMQFNDFSASAFNQIVNNAAKLFYRTGIGAPFVLRMPFGGLRRAGPYHSQDTIPWFHRAFGLNIVAPSTPSDARGLFHAAIQDSNPVLFYEHIALYREPSIKEILSSDIPKIELGKAALRRTGSDLTIVSYGAFVHRAIAVAQKLEQEKNLQCDVIDLRSLVPLDFETIGTSIQKTNRVLLLTEDSRTGSFMESLASKIAEGLFEKLDAPIRVLGSLDTPVPYSPPLEDAYLPSNDEIFQEALELIQW